MKGLISITEIISAWEKRKLCEALETLQLVEFTMDEGFVVTNFL